MLPLVPRAIICFKPLWRGSHFFCTAKPNIRSESSEPLRVLFCGSDEFSIASLKAIYQEHAQDRALIESIDVLHRPAKRTGRGLRYVREVPIEAVTTSLGLTRHMVDGFKGWEMPDYINLIVAVSFGLLIPERMIRTAKFGGLNVHPSLLPDLRGAAPLHHTLLRRRQYTGVSVQTLHPTKFDHGTILAQTPFPGMTVSKSDKVESLTARLAPVGAEMLVSCIRNRQYIDPAACQTLTTSQMIQLTGGEGPKMASKIGPNDREIDWVEHKAADILLRQSVLGNLWDVQTFNSLVDACGSSAHRVSAEAWSPVKRLIFHDLTIAELENPMSARSSAPCAIITDDVLYIRTLDDVVLRTQNCTLESGALGAGVKDLRKATRASVKTRSYISEI